MPDWTGHGGPWSPQTSDRRMCAPFPFWDLEGAHVCPSKRQFVSRKQFRSSVTVALALSVWPAEIIFDSSGDKLRQVWLLLSCFLSHHPPHPPFLKSCYLKPSHVISNILKVAGILHHHWTILRGCLWEKIRVQNHNCLFPQIRYKMRPLTFFSFF